MKAIRTYLMSSGTIYLTSVLMPEGDSLELPNQVKVECIVDPLYYDPDQKFLSLSCTPDTAFEDVLNELQTFINTLKQMYYGT